VKYIITLLFLFIFCIYSYCQNIVISVKDAVTSNSITNSYISNDLNKGVLTDSSGLFIWGLITKNSNKIKISALGYKEIIINTSEIPKSNTIYLEPRYSILKEVTIYSNPNNILKKSINSIKNNYFNLPFKLNGLYKTYNIDTLNNYYFTSEALLNYYINPTNKDDISRTLVAKLISKLNRSSTVHWYGYGTYYDPVLSKSGIINLLSFNKYNFINYGIFEYNGRKTYMIEYTLKKDNYLNGVIYIDSLSKAFVKIIVDYYNPPKEAFMKKIVYAKKEVEYTTIDNKWYVKYFKSTTQHENYTYPTIISDFLTINVDTSNFIYPKSEIFMPNNIDNGKIRANSDAIFTKDERIILADTAFFRVIPLNTNLFTIDINNDSIINKNEYKKQQEKLLNKTIPISRSGYGINISQPFKIDPTIGIYIESKNIYNFRLGIGYNNNLKLNNTNQSTIMVDVYYTNKSNENKSIVIHPLIQFQSFYGKKKVDNILSYIDSHTVSGGIKIDYHTKSDRLLSGKLTYNFPYLYGSSTLNKNSINFSIIYSGILY
jgi:hypothetical protein